MFAPTTMHQCCFRASSSTKTNQLDNVLASWLNTPEFAKAQRQREKVEALFAELKNQIGLRRLRLRRLKFVREQFFLAAAAQNIKRLVRFLSQRPHRSAGHHLVERRQENRRRMLADEKAFR